MNRRFYAERPINEQQIVLEGPDAHHLINVLRCQIGDEIELFDGTGFQFIGQIREISRKKVVVEIIESRSRSRELAHRVIVATAIPKGERQRLLIEKLVELGCSQWIPLTTVRSVGLAKEKSILKFNRWVIEASKQCGRNRLMKIDKPVSIEEIIHRTFDDANRLIAHPGRDIVKLNSLTKKSSVILIGPEGGFTDDEIDATRMAGWNAVSLGPTILRIETAAIAAATLLGIGQDRTIGNGSI